MSTFALRTTAANATELATAAFSAEFACVLACLRWPLDAAAMCEVERAADAVTDWMRFVAIAQRHRVTGLAAHALKKAGVDVPGEARAALGAGAAEQTRQAMVHAAETIRVDRLLRASGVEPVFLKGSTLTLLAYGRLELRHAKDVDVLVSEGDALAAITALRGAGYVPFAGGPVTAEQTQRWLRFGKSMDWLHGVTGLLLELHWRMSDLPLLQGALGSDERQSVALAGGAAVTTLDADHLLAYLCVHGAAHGWSRLKWLADVYALLPRGDVEAVYRRLVALGAGRSAGQALLLCECLLGLPLGAALRKELMRDARLRLLVRMALRLLARGGEVAEIYDLRFGTSSVYLSRFLLGKGAGAAAAEMGTLLFPVEQVAVSRLPERMLFLFPFVRAFDWVGSRVRHGGRSA